MITPETISNIFQSYSSKSGLGWYIVRYSASTPDAPSSGNGICIINHNSTNYGAILALSDAGLYYAPVRGGALGAWEKVNN